MEWMGRSEKTGSEVKLTPEQVADYDKEKESGLPVITREVEKGEVPFDPIRFTPVRSPGIYEAEFAKKDGDVIFHFWPYGYAQAVRLNQPAPPFKRDFELVLKAVFVTEFGGKDRVVFKNDRSETGAFFVKVLGLGEKQFYRELVKTACEKLHYGLGGK